MDCCGLDWYGLDMNNLGALVIAILNLRVHKDTGKLSIRYIYWLASPIVLSSVELVSNLYP
jgi:hypothetical protein